MKKILATEKNYLNFPIFIRYLKYKIILRKKNLTTSQIEHILKKNNVPIPKDHNVSFFKRSISNHSQKAGKGFQDFIAKQLVNVGRFFKKTKGERQGYTMILLGSW